MCESLGIKVKLVHYIAGCPRTEELRNVTEIHYRYPGLRGKRIAFESDVHGTGITYDLDVVTEFEATPETEIAEEF